jgi:hypothetical protein
MQIKPFYRSITLANKIQAILAKPIDQGLKNIELAALPIYVSRGHGKKGFELNHNWRHVGTHREHGPLGVKETPVFRHKNTEGRSKYTPHWSTRETARRVHGSATA